jgi:hypothetical protein
MKQETFKRENYYGNIRKCVLTIWGRGKYSVAYFKNPEALKADNGTADFKTRKDAMYSIDCHLA